MAAELEGYTNTVVISFIDLYEKVKRNFPEARELSITDRVMIGKEIIRIAGEHGMTVRPCSEGDLLEPYGADCRGCMTLDVYEKAIHHKLKVPSFKPAREGCICYLSGDIGAYDSCGHLCRYCYANNDAKKVKENMLAHDVHSPFLIGNYEETDIIHDAEQKSWKDIRLSLFE